MPTHLQTKCLPSRAFPHYRAGTMMSIAGSTQSQYAELGSVIVESLLGLAAQVTRIDHLAQQWRGAIFIVTEIALKDFHHKQHHIEADHIC